MNSRSVRHLSNTPVSWCLLVLFAELSGSATALQIKGGLTQSGLPATPLQDIRVLEAGKPVIRSLSGDQAHRYQIQLQKGQCAEIHVEQRGLNVVLQLQGTDSDAAVEVDDEIGQQGTEKLDVIAERDGAYTLRVTPKLKSGNGIYEIRLVEVRAATSLDQKLDEVQRVRTRVHHLLEVDQLGEALPLAQQAFTLVQQAGLDDAYIALVQADLADVKSALRQIEDARPMYEHTLQVLTAKLGPEHPQTISVSSRLGNVYADLMEYTLADQLLSQTLEKSQRILGPEDPIVASTLRGLAILHSDRGDYVQAEGELEHALAILEKASSTEGRFYSGLLNNLGYTYKEQGEFEKAGIYFERVLAIQEERFGPDSPTLAKTLSNLGIVARQRKDNAAAEKYFLRSLAIKEKYVGTQDFDYAAVLMNLANVYSSEGDYQKALETHLRAFAVFEKYADSDASPFIPSLANIVKTYAALGDFENANKVQARLESALERGIAFNLAIGSEREKLAFLDSVAERTDRAISLNLQLEPDNADATAIAATILLQRKGRSLDATTDTLSALRKRSDPQDQVLLDQLKEVTTQLARVSLQGPQKQSLEEHRKTLHALQEKKENLENLISRHNEAFRVQAQAVTLQSVQAAIPDNIALLEFLTYRLFNPKAQTDAEQYGNRHYAVYVLHRNAAPKGVDLGDAKEVDAAIEKLRAALREPNRSDARQLAQTVARLVFQPLQSLVAGDQRLLISPDGQLNLIPFEALPDSDGRYLVERFSITYLTTGRDLLRMQVPRPSRSAPVLVADPQFGEPNGNQVAGITPPQVQPVRARAARRSVTTGSDFSNLYFAPLAGTRAEAGSIHSLFPNALVLTGEQASEAALKQLNGPEILHIATHGFFLQDRADSHADSTEDPENPLLRSGLALSGANRVKDGKGDGILTALEASTLDLWGTKLVTLSACDTGVGEVKDHEGIYGLRRSFLLAGAESLVMSLWPASDYVTREIMTSYYGGLKRGLGRGEALRQAQLSMLKQKGREHPFYWASFIQAGEWANLDGQR